VSSPWLSFMQKGSSMSTCLVIVIDKINKLALFLGSCLHPPFSSDSRCTATCTWLFVSSSISVLILFWWAGCSACINVTSQWQKWWRHLRQGGTQLWQDQTTKATCKWQKDGVTCATHQRRGDVKWRTDLLEWHHGKRQKRLVRHTTAANKLWIQS
jgi:hypothetical protein